jgi:hypothetical protein
MVHLGHTQRAYQESHLGPKTSGTFIKVGKWMNTLLFSLDGSSLLCFSINKY